MNSLFQSDSISSAKQFNKTYQDKDSEEVETQETENDTVDEDDLASRVHICFRLGSSKGCLK